MRGFDYCANTSLHEASSPVLSVIVLATFAVDKGDAVRHHKGPPNLTKAEKSIAHILRVEAEGVIAWFRLLR